MFVFIIGTTFSNLFQMNGDVTSSIDRNRIRTSPYMFIGIDGILRYELLVSQQRRCIIASSCLYLFNLTYISKVRENGNLRTVKEGKFKDDCNLGFFTRHVLITCPVVSLTWPVPYSKQDFDKSGTNYEVSFDPERYVNYLFI
jgi:hypothetical protein